MDEFVFVFTKFNEEAQVEYKFEVVSRDGDGCYWAFCNGGYCLSSNEIADLLNGHKTIENILDSYYASLKA